MQCMFVKYLLWDQLFAKKNCLRKFYWIQTYIHGRRVCKAHLGTCLGEKNLGALFEAPRSTAKS